MAPPVHSKNSTAFNGVCAYVSKFLNNSVPPNCSGEGFAFCRWQNSSHAQGPNPVIYLAIPKHVPSHLLPFNQSMSHALRKVIANINKQLRHAGVSLQYKPANATHQPDINVYAWEDIPGAYAGNEHPAAVFFNLRSIIVLVRIVLHELLHFFRGTHPQDSPEFQTASPEALALLCNLHSPFSSLLYPESCPVYQGVPDIHELFNRNLTVGVGDVGLIQYRLAISPEEQGQVVAQTCIAANHQFDLLGQKPKQKSKVFGPSASAVVNHGASWYHHPAALQAGASFGKAFVETLLLNVLLDRLSLNGRIGLRRILVPMASVALEWSLLSRLQFDGKCLAMAALPRVFDALLPTTLRTLAKPLGYLGYAKTLALFWEKRPVVALLSFAAGVGSAFAGRAAAEALTTLALGKERSQAVCQTWEEGYPECDIWYDAREFFEPEPGVKQAWHAVKRADQAASPVLGAYFGANALFRRLLDKPFTVAAQ